MMLDCYNSDSAPVSVPVLCDSPGVPNLDCMTEFELAGVESALKSLGRYCEHKSRAIVARCEGDIEMALHHEGVCEAIYAGLPAWARW